MCLVGGILGDLSGLQFESFLCFNEDVFHVDGRELEGSILSFPFHSCITIYILDLQVFPAIVRLIMYRVTCL